MTIVRRELPVPLYLFLCLLLGGSAQGIWANFILQLLGIALLAWALLGPGSPMSAMARRLFWLGGLAVLFLLLQLVPLPPSVWSALPGCDFVAQGLTLLGDDAPWMPVSLAPYATMSFGLALIVSLAILVAMIRRRAYSNALLVAALLAGTFAGCLLGILQVGSGNKDWYLYRFSAFGMSTGFFANGNHMGTLLLATAPFLIALASDHADATRSASARATIKVAAAAGAVLLAVSIALNGSLAVLLIGLPVALACAALLALGRQPQRRRWIAMAALVALVAAVGAAGLFRDRLATSNLDSFSTRAEIWATTARAIGDMGLAGSGIGSFPSVYPHYEAAAQASSTYVNHAHNDYLELLLETGLAGSVLVALFLLWWCVAALRCWRDPLAGPYARAATIASATILLHSLVDYPLRTAALAAVFAVSLGLMALRKSRAVVAEKNELRPSRHRSFA